jgi:hypothetical protein
MLYRRGLVGFFTVLLGLLFHNAARADLIFVTNYGNGTIGEYTTAGATVNPALISGLPYPIDIAVVPTIPEPGGAILTLFGLVLIGLVVKKIKKDGIPAAGGHTIPTKRQTPTARIFQRLLAAGPSPICWRMGRPY